MEPLDGVEHGPLRHGYAGRAGQDRPEGADQAALHRQHALHVPAERLRQREQPQRLRGGGAVDDHDVPLPRAGLLAELEEGEDLLRAGDHGQLLGRDRVDTGDVEDREQVVLDLGPRLLEAELGVDLLHEEPVGHLGGLRAHRLPEGVGQRVGRVGRQDQRAVAGRRGECGRAGCHRRLADPALAREEQDPHESCSTRFFRPLSAVSIRIFSPLRLSMPISGMERSSASR